ncbi:MAG TPA: NAD(P)-dependent oxidoreductase [Jatrophihabitantaceae bacterium]|jgi:nucleoside-diphosphate-sugar epimerase
MRILVAGGTGALGQHLLPQLVASGHDVTALTRSEAKSAAVRQAGAEAVVADALDRESVVAAVRAARPDVVIHQLTALSQIKSFRKFDQEFALTNRLRTEGTDNLLAGAQAAGARRFIAQSFAGWPLERAGSRVKAEEDPLDPSPPANQRRSFAAIQHLEQAVGKADLEGIVLRYGGFYGPGSNMTGDGDIAQLVRKRRFPIVGDGQGVWSFCHLSDAAAATVAAVDHGAPGIYNVCDDEPVEIATWLPDFAQAIGAPAPRHVPTWLGRLLGGEIVVSVMTRVRGASNAKAKATLDWKPRFATYREGFRAGLD